MGASLGAAYSILDDPERRYTSPEWADMPEQALAQNRAEWDQEHGLVEPAGVEQNGLTKAAGALGTIVGAVGGPKAGKGINRLARLAKLVPKSAGASALSYSE